MKTRKSFLNPAGIAVVLSTLTIILGLLGNIVAPSLAMKISLQFWIILIFTSTSVVILTAWQAQSQKKTEQSNTEMLQEMTLLIALSSVFQATSPEHLNIRWLLDTLNAKRKERFIHVLNENGRLPMITITQLQGVDLQGVQLSQMSLQGVQLQGANLSHANLSGADLQNADLSHANLSGAQLQGANLSHAIIRDTDLSEAHLEQATMCKVDLSHANLNGAQLQGAILQEAKLLEAHLRSAHLQDADLSHADLSKAQLNSTDLRNAKLVQAKLNEAKLGEADLSSADLSSAELCGANLWGREVTPPTPPYRSAAESVVYWTNLSRAKLRGANLTGADLGHVDLSYADLYGATLTKTVLDPLRNRSKDAIGPYSTLRLDGTKLSNY